MEYLDPEKKRKHRQRIALGYLLIGLLISMVTIIVLLAGYGYGFDRNTGEFVQNGIMFVDTKHRPATVSLNGEQYGETDLRLVLKEGEYTLVAQRDGYRDWNRTVQVYGGDLRILTYGLLVPETLSSVESAEIEYQPSRAIQSVDKNRIVTWSRDNPELLVVFDISGESVSAEEVPLSELIDQLELDDDEGSAVITDIEFTEFDSSDRRVVAEVQTADDARLTWLIDTESPDDSIDIGLALPSAFRSDDLSIDMIDRDATRYYVFDKTEGEVYQAELRGDNLSLVTVRDIDQKVLAFEGFDNDWILYVTESDGDAGLVDLMFRQSDETVQIKQMKTSKSYMLTLGNNRGKPFMGVGASEETAVFVYIDPVQYLKENTGSVVPSPASIMPIEGVLNVSLSTDASVFLAHSKNRVATFDFRSRETFYKDLDHELTSKDQLKWIDGQHYSYVDSGTSWAVDYDGSNQHQLTAASAVGVFYREDSEGYFTFTTNDVQEEDEPPALLVFTSLLSENDQ